MLRYRSAIVLMTNMAGWYKIDIEPVVGFI